MKQHIYQQLEGRRRQLRWSQQDLAARAGLRREKLNRMESRGENIGFEELCRLLDAAGLELHVRERQRAPALPAAAQSRRLEPQDFRKASFIDGAKAKILDWGKAP